MLTFITPRDQLWIIQNIKDRLPKNTARYVNSISYHDLLRVSRLEQGSVVFTGLGVITDTQRKAATEIYQQLKKKSRSLRLLNHPEQSLRRLDLIKKLHSLGINDYSAFKAGEIPSVSLRFPVFVREARRHSGSLTGLIDNLPSLISSIKSLKRAGYPENDLLVVEFFDTSDENGLFRKYSALKFGDVIIPRYLSLGYNWVVKENEPDPDSGTLYDDRKIKDELDYIKNNPHRNELEKIFSLAKIDYGRIDYGMKGDKLQVWEINTLPTFGGAPGFQDKVSNSARKAARSEAKEIFYKEFIQAVGALIDRKNSETVAVKLPDSIRRPLAREERKQKIVNAAVYLGEKFPRIPVLNTLRTIVKRRLRRKNESSPKI